MREAESNALTDPLTGLPNARYMALRFDEEASRARRNGRPFQVVMLDLDDFKIVNDTFGHKVGDKMLREMAPHHSGPTSRVRLSCALCRR